jgi:hypothetical protein
MVAVALAFAGCGGSTRPAASTAAPPTTTVDKCNGSKSAAVRARKQRQVTRDLARLRVLAKPIQTRTPNGTLALSNALMLPQHGNVDEAYYAKNIGVIEERLAVAGARLAQVINRALTSRPPG